MNRTLSRRTALALAGMGVLGTGTVRAQGAATSYTFKNGNEFVWAAPWEGYPTNGAYFLLADTVSLSNTTGGQLVVGYTHGDIPTTLEDIVESKFTKSYGAGPYPEMIAGGSEETSFEGNTVKHDFAVYLGTNMGQNAAFFFMLTNGEELKYLACDPPSKLGEVMASVQSTSTLNGTPVFDGIDGTDLNDALASVANVGTSEYTDASGLLHLQFPATWQVISQNEFGTELANPESSFVFAAEARESLGLPPNEVATQVFFHYLEDQGETAKFSVMDISTDRYMFATDGQYGLRLIHGIFTDDPEKAIVIRVSDFKGEATDGLSRLAEALTAFEEVRAGILVNGKAPLEGMESHIAQVLTA